MENKIIVLILSMWNVMAMITLLTIISKSLDSKGDITIDSNTFIFLLFTIIFNYVSVLIINKK